MSLSTVCQEWNAEVPVGWLAGDCMVSLASCCHGYVEECLKSERCELNRKVEILLYYIGC